MALHQKLAKKVIKLSSGKFYVRVISKIGDGNCPPRLYSLGLGEKSYASKQSTINLLAKELNYLCNC